MKKSTNCIEFYICLGFLLFANSLKLSAQNFAFGIRYEPEFSALMNKNDGNAGPALNYTSHFTYLNFGVGATYNINKNMGLTVDVLFSREGQNFTGNFNETKPDPATYSSVVATQAFLNNLVITGDYAAKAELNFIKLPVMFLFSTDNTKLVYFTFSAGPQLNILYNVAQEVNHVDRDYPNTNITPIDLYKPVTINGVLELGAECNISSHIVLSANARIDYGFEDVENKNVMVSYYGAPQSAFYSPNRNATHNATAGLLIGVDYKL
jgi:hypothetical protein